MHSQLPVSEKPKLACNEDMDSLRYLMPPSLPRMKSAGTEGVAQFVPAEYRM